MGKGSVRLREVVADAQELHLDSSNAGALFQVASQFNTLEMASSSITPEDGIDQYELDRTQGPACAVACGAGTIYRNYLVPVEGGIGQTAERQVDCLADLAALLEFEVDMVNGYAFATREQLLCVSERLDSMTLSELDQVRSALRIGLQWNTEVTLNDAGHVVSQAYCSAVPVAYSPVEAIVWQPFARLVLDASYEAVFAAAVLNARATGNNNLFLTLIGGGVFGNHPPWILKAIERAAGVYAGAELDVAIVSFGQPNPSVQSVIG